MERKKVKCINSFLCNKTSVRVRPIVDFMEYIITPYTKHISISCDSQTKHEDLQKALDLLAVLLSKRCRHLVELQIVNCSQTVPFDLSKLADSLNGLETLQKLILNLPILPTQGQIIKVMNNNGIQVFELPFYVLEKEELPELERAFCHTQELSSVAFNFLEMEEGVLRQVLQEIECHPRIHQIPCKIPWKSGIPHDLVRYSKIESIKLSFNYALNTKFEDCISFTRTIKKLSLRKMKTIDIMLFLSVLIENKTIEDLTLGVVRSPEVYEKIGEMLLKNTTLKHLCLMGASFMLFSMESTPMLDPVFKALISNKSLLSLKSKGGGIDIVELAEALKQNNTLEYIRLKDTLFLSSNPSFRLSEMLFQCSRICELYIIHPEIDSKLQTVSCSLFEELVAMLHSNSLIKKLFYAKGLLGSPEQSAIRQHYTDIEKDQLRNCIAHNTQLQSLIIRNILIPIELIKSILYGLMHNRFCTSVCLENVGISDKSVNILGELLLLNQKLKIISLAYNSSITLQGVLVIISALKVAKNLSIIDLKGVNIGLNDKKIISRKLKGIISSTTIVF